MRKKEPEHRINEHIRVPEVRLVGDNVETGVYPTRQALQLADELELDLVEISPNATPPVCKIIDYSKFVYEQKKKQKEIKANDYSGAIKTLEAANQNNSADWNNLLGYAQRKKTPPDLASAERYYQSALKLDPKHKGALEYYGELLLMKNDLAGAEQMLARLDKVCLFSCEEFRDLKEAIARFKSKK